MATSLSNPETWSLIALSLASSAVIVQTFQGDGAPVVASLAFSGLAFAASYALIRWLGDAFVKAGLKGRDMSKRHKKEMYVRGQKSFYTSWCDLPQAQIAEIQHLHPKHHRHCIRPTSADE